MNPRKTTTLPCYPNSKTHLQWIDIDSLLVIWYEIEDFIELDASEVRSNDCHAIVDYLKRQFHHCPEMHLGQPGLTVLPLPAGRSGLPVKSGFLSEISRSFSSSNQQRLTRSFGTFPCPLASTSISNGDWRYWRLSWRHTRITRPQQPTFAGFW